MNSGQTVQHLSSACKRLPRCFDSAFDGRGNYTLGVKEQIIFPEIDFDKVNKSRGMDVVIVTTADTNEEAKELLTALGMPFVKK